jgi:hypothetical protein
MQPGGTNMEASRDSSSRLVGRFEIPNCTLEDGQLGRHLLWIYKIWGSHGGGFEEWRLLGYRNPVRSYQETHYLFTTEPTQLMLCKIWGFHGGNYEECRLLGYKTPVLTSQETHYVSGTESSQLMLRNIWGFHGCDYEESRLLGCCAVWLL